MNMKKVLYFILIFSSVVSCKQDVTQQAQPVTTGNLTIQVGYRFDASSLLTDTILYTNAAGFKMSVTRLQYFISDINLTNANGGSYLINQAFFMDAKDLSFASINLTNVPFGNYTGMTFNIGLDSVMNVPYGLPLTPENNNMVWPTTMGGGYHFMKMEGYYIDTATVYGYTMHLGKNASRVPITLSNKSFSISSTPANVKLKMNVSEWFKNPLVFDFDKDGNYTMGNDALMIKLKNNGVDVFND